MNVPRLLLPALLAAMIGVHGAFAAAALPPVAGELAGSLSVLALPGAPPFAWRVELQPAAAGGLRVAVSATAPGLNLQAETTLPADGVAGQWKIIRGTVDLARWWHVAASQVPLAGLPADLEVDGTLELTGAGELQGGEVKGTVGVKLGSGSARSATQNWEATDIALTGALALGPDGARLLDAKLSVPQARYAAIAAKKLELDVAGAAGGSLRVERASVEILGGRVSLKPFEVNPREPVVATTADFMGLALSDLAQLMPQALTEARGQLNGRIMVRWSAKMGLEPGTGALTVESASPAALRLAPNPGFLTGRVPVKITFLPAWLGPLARWTAVENPAYETLQKIEVGALPLNVESLNVQLYPDGPDGVRSATVEVSARPAPGSMVERVTFQLNVAGPLSQVLRLGLNDRFKVKAGPKK